MNEILKAHWTVGEKKLSGCVLGNGETLAICLPGFSLSGEWMAKHYPALWTNKTCYFLDWPGLGEVELEDTPFDIDILKDWIKKVMSEKKWNKIYLIGHSFGAKVCLKLLLEMPFAEELILIAPVIKIRFWEHLIQSIPNVSYEKLINQLFSLSSMEGLIKAAYKLGFLNAQERTFLTSHFNSAKMLKFLKHYAIALRSLRIKKSEIEQILNSVKNYKICLFKNDRFCENTFWINTSKDKDNCELILFEGGHFTRIRS